MAGVIDTNLLLYGANSDAPEHEVAAAFLTAAGRSTSRWYLTEGIVYEFLRVSTHPRVFPRPLSWSEALGYLDVFSRSPNFSILGAGERHWVQLEELLGELTHPAGNLFFDVRTATLMREHGIRAIYTADTDFLQFSEIEVVNPLENRRRKARSRLRSVRLDPESSSTRNGVPLLPPREDEEPVTKDQVDRLLDDE